MGYKWRHHSPENIQEHIDLITKEYGCDYLHFEDDNFTHDPERFDEIIEKLRTGIINYSKSKKN